MIKTRKPAKKKSKLAAGWANLRSLLEKGDPRRSFAGKFLSEHSRVIQTAKSSPQRRQKVKRRKRVLMARKQRITRALVSAAKLTLFAAAVTTLGIKALGYMYSSPRFSIAHIAVAGNTHVTARQVIDKSKIVEGQNIFRVSLTDSVKAIEEIPWVQHARIEKVLPNEVRIDIKERSPVALVLSHKLFLIDEGAVVVAEFDSSENLAAPIITVNNIGSLKPGDTLKNKGISAALEIVRLMNAMNLEENIRISEISIDKPPNIFMVAERSGASILLGSGDFEGKLWRLARVADAIARDESLRLANLERMDMRFRTIVPAKFRGS